MVTAVKKTEVETEATTPVETAAARLAATEGIAAPLRERLAALEGEMAALAAFAEPEDLSAALAARRDREKKRSELELERGLLTERLQPLSEEIAVLAAEAKAEALRTETEAAEARGASAVAEAEAIAVKLLDAVAEVRRLRDEDRRAGLRWSMALLRSTNDLANTLAKCKNLLQGAGR